MSIEGLKVHDQHEDHNQQQEEEKVIQQSKIETQALILTIGGPNKEAVAEIFDKQQKLSYSNFQKEVQKLQKQYEKGFTYKERTEKQQYVNEIEATARSFVQRYQKARDNRQPVDTIKKDALVFASIISGESDSGSMIAKKRLAPASGSIIDWARNATTGESIHEHPEQVISAVNMLVAIFEDTIMDENISKQMVTKDIYEKPSIAYQHKDLQSMLGENGLGKGFDNVQWALFLGHTDILRANVHLPFEQLTFDQKVQLNLIIKVINNPSFAKNAAAGNWAANKTLLENTQQQEAQKIVDRVKNDKSLQNKVETLLENKMEGLSGTDKEIADTIKSLYSEYEDEMEKLGKPEVIQASRGYLIAGIIGLIVGALGVAWAIKSDSYMGTMIRKMFGIHLRQEQEVREDSEGEIDASKIEKQLALTTVKGPVKGIAMTATYGDDLNDKSNWVEEIINNSNKKTVQVTGDVMVNGNYDFQKGGLSIYKTKENGEIYFDFELPPLSYTVNAEESNLRVGKQSNGVVRWIDQALFGEGTEELNIAEDAKGIAYNSAKETIESSRSLEKIAEESARELFVGIEEMNDVPAENITITFRYKDGTVKTVDGNGKEVAGPRSGILNLNKKTLD